ESFAERTVAGQRGRTCGDEVADTGETGERGRLGPEGGSEPGDLGETAGDDARDGVLTEPDPGGHAAREGDDVLAGATDLAADYVGIGVRSEILCGAGLLDLHGAGGVGAREDGRGRLSPGDLTGVVGAGQPGAARLLGAGDATGHLTDPHQAAALGSLG